MLLEGFNYTKLLENILFKKFNILNFFILPKLDKIILDITVFDLKNYKSLKFIQALEILRFLNFFENKPHIKKISIRYLNGKKFIKITFRLTINRLNKFRFIFYFFNVLRVRINKKYYKYNFIYNNNVIHYFIKNLSIVNKNFYNYNYGMVIKFFYNKNFKNNYYNFSKNLLI